MYAAYSSACGSTSARSPSPLALATASFWHLSARAVLILRRQVRRGVPSDRRARKEACLVPAYLLSFFFCIGRVLVRVIPHIQYSLVLPQTLTRKRLGPCTPHRHCITTSFSLHYSPSRPRTRAGNSTCTECVPDFHTSTEAMSTFQP